MESIEMNFWPALVSIWDCLRSAVLSYTAHQETATLCYRNNKTNTGCGKKTKFQKIVLQFSQQSLRISQWNFIHISQQSYKRSM